MRYYNRYYTCRRKLRSHIPTIWTDGKAEVGRVREEKRRSEKRREEKTWQEKRREEKTRDERRREERRVEEKRREEKKKKEHQGARKGRKIAKHCVSPMICGSGGSKSRLAKAAGAEPSREMRNKQVHTVVARSKFRSKNAQNTSTSEHFWKLRCRQSARRCGAKHISKSKCTKHLSFGALLEIEMLKKCTPLWRDAHLEVNMLKTPHVRATFGSWDVEKVHPAKSEQSVRVL